MSKLAKLRAEIETAGIQAFMITRPENRRYISGFHGSAGTLVVTQASAYLLTDFRYIEQAQAQAPEFQVVKIGEPGQDALQDVLAADGISSLGFEQDYVTYAEYERLTKRLTAELVPLSGIVEKLRRVKTEEEIAVMQQATEIAEAAFAQVLPEIKVGRTELEVALDLEFAMRRLGAEGMAFSIIAASGPRSSLPHGGPTQRVLQAGDFLTLDFGAVHGGYCSDMTRTVVLGQPSEKQLEIYGIVLQAQLQAQAAVRPGMPGKEVDQVARDIIAAAGYGDYFGHGLGHGVGLQVHEGPSAGKTSTDILEPGMVVTIEPGIYIPDFGGVRIEDMVLVTETGHQNFNSASKELIIIA